MERVQCKKCKHDWIPRTENHAPRKCPKCQTYFWQTKKWEIKLRNKKIRGEQMLMIDLDKKVIGGNATVKNIKKYGLLKASIMQTKNE